MERRSQVEGQADKRSGKGFLPHWIRRIPEWRRLEEEGNLRVRAFSQGWWEGEEGRSDGRRTQFPLRCIFLSHFSRDRRQVGDRSSYKMTETNALQHSMKIKGQHWFWDFIFYSIWKTKHFPYMGAVSLPPIQRKDGCSKERVSLKKLTLSSYLGIRAVLELPWC